MDMKKVTLIFILLGAFWTLLIFGLAFAGKEEIFSANTSLAEASASAFLEQTVNTRSWNAAFGGVYVPLTKETPVNPYLTVPEKIITTDEGEQLTLINPAYMTRQIFEVFEKKEGIEGKITSLDPINPDNAPDEWEEAALLAFEKGSEKASDIIGENGEKMLRFMVPLSTEQSCLRCHAEQGYEVGDIRGGLSLTLPFDPYADASHRTFSFFLSALITIALLGYGGFYLSWRSIDGLLRNLYSTNKKLQTSVEKNILLRREADHRIKNNLSVVESLISLKMMESRDKTERLYTHLADIRSKVEVVSSLHDILHQTSRDTDRVDLKIFLSKIIDITVGQFTDGSITYDTHLDSCEVNSEKAVPIGMVLTELILNALKHGILCSEEKRLSVSLLYEKEELVLRVANPISDEKKIESSGFGSELINSIAESLGGKLDFVQKEQLFIATCMVKANTL